MHSTELRETVQLVGFEFEPCAEINHLEDGAQTLGSRTLWSGLIKDVPMGTSTSIANGLSQQLIEQMNLIDPNTLVSCEDLNIQLLPAAYPLLQPQAKVALAKAMRERGVALQLNSGYRTIVQQQILYNQRHLNSNPVAYPGNSNHQSGVALDIEEPRAWDPFLIKHGWHPLAKDPPHFDFGRSRDIRKIATLAFQQLWNQNNPEDLIAEDGDYGPTTEAKVNQSPVMGFKIAPWKHDPRILKLKTPRMAGHDVRELQNALIAAGLETEADGIFGPGTDKVVKQFQSKAGLSDDGVVGNETRIKLGLTVKDKPLAPTKTPLPENREDRPIAEAPDKAISDGTVNAVNSGNDGSVLVLKLTKPPMKGEVIRRLQAALTLADLDVEVSGVFDSMTDDAVRSFQKANHLKADGIVGSQTLQVLQQIAPSLSLVNKPGKPSLPTLETKPGNALDSLETALKFTLKWEGGKVDHSDDLGGRTNRGITQRVYNRYRADKGLATQDVFEATLAETYEIYKQSYWQPSKAELMILPLAVVQFDTAVLFGVGGAVKFLQEALGVKVDGGFGPKTRAALEANNTQAVAIAIINSRIAYHQQRVKKKPSQQVFLQGWLNRANDLKAFITSL